MTVNHIADTAWGEHEPEPLDWARGPWSLQLRGDELADLRYDGTVVLRSVRAVARDRDWGTVPSVVEYLDASESQLRIGIGMRGLDAEIAGVVLVRVDGDRLTIDFDATVGGDFWSNRLGLVVLHPPTVAGAALTVTTPVGERTTTSFPRRISPHQPAFDISRLDWTDGGVASSLKFSGDTFEMEDQRNWTDASFKTYSTPLALPFPVLVEAGKRIEQSIALTARRVKSVAAPAGVHDVTLTRSERRVPEIATSVSTAAGDVPPDFESRASTLIVELDARTPTWRAALARAVTEAGVARADVRLDARLVIERADQLDPLLDALSAASEASGLRIERLGVFSASTHVTEPELWEALAGRASGRAALETTALLGGTRGHFTELNRTTDRLPMDVDAVTFSLTPQMHATNRYQLVESIAMQGLVAENAVALAGGLPVHVGPVTLRARFNAVATSSGVPRGIADPDAGYGAEPVADATDPRQSASALTAWTVASAAAIGISGVASISYFETWGPRGTFGFPVQQAMDWLAEIAGAPLLLLDGAGPLPPEVWMLAAAPETGPVALVANISDGVATIVIAYEGRTYPAQLAALSATRVPLS